MSFNKEWKKAKKGVSQVVRDLKRKYVYDEDKNAEKCLQLLNKAEGGVYDKKTGQKVESLNDIPEQDIEREFKKYDAPEGEYKWCKEKFKNLGLVSEGELSKVADHSSFASLQVVEACKKTYGSVTEKISDENPCSCVYLGKWVEAGIIGAQELKGYCEEEGEL